MEALLPLKSRLIFSSLLDDGSASSDQTQQENYGWQQTSLCLFPGQRVWLGLEARTLLRGD